jgi:hypothetical protein
MAFKRVIIRRVGPLFWLLGKKMFRKAFWILFGWLPLLGVTFAWLVGPTIIDKIIALPPERYNAFSDWWLAYW